MLTKKTTDDAVVGVVTAILIVGLIVAVVSLVQTMYIPKIMEEREADHMDKVAEQFTDLTSVIDGQAANPNPIHTMPIATSITLGSKELPYMLSIRAYGTLEILDNARKITINYGSGQQNISEIGVITYSSKNGYFLDQSYTYEAGAMIVNQSEGNLMMIRPSFSVDKKNNPLTITFDVVNIISIGEKTISSGFGTYPIQTEFRDNSSRVTFTDVDNIIITTPLSNAWYVFLKNALSGTPATPTYIEQGLMLNFSEDTIVNFKIINIKAQIGPGWVE